MLQAVFYEQNDFDGNPVEVGRCVVSGGSAHTTTQRIQDLLAETNVVAPASFANAGDVVDPEDGEMYVSCLPMNFSGSRFWAVLEHSV